MLLSKCETLKDFKRNIKKVIDTRHEQKGTTDSVDSLFYKKIKCISFGVYKEASNKFLELSNCNCCSNSEKVELLVRIKGKESITKVCSFFK